MASIAIGDMAGTQTVKRTVKNVTGSPATYTPAVSEWPASTSQVQPASLVVPAGGNRNVHRGVHAHVGEANVYTGGQLTLSDGVAQRSPADGGAAGGARGAARSDGDGHDRVVRRGVRLHRRVLRHAARPHRSTTNAATVADDPTNGTCSLTVPGTVKYEIAVPAGTTYARFAMTDADVNPGSDIDLCVFNWAPPWSASAAPPRRPKTVNLVDPEAGTYTVVVHGWGVAGSTPFTLHHWLLGSASAGNMTVTAPPAATTGATGTIGLSFSGLAAGKRYLGSVAYAGTDGMPDPTIVRIDTP